VDSGSFGVFINGRRVATETFSVRQPSAGSSTISSQLKDESGGAGQTSEMQITSTGALVRYEWHELSPGKSMLVVAPNNEFLLETVSRIVIPLFAFETRVVVPRLSREERMQSLGSHERVIELLRAGDSQTARRAMAEMMAAFQQQTRGLAPGRP